MISIKETTTNKNSKFQRHYLRLNRKKTHISGINISLTDIKQIGISIHEFYDQVSFIIVNMPQSL